MEKAPTPPGVGAQTVKKVDAKPLALAFSLYLAIIYMIILFKTFSQSTIW